MLEQVAFAFQFFMMLIAICTLPGLGIYLYHNDPNKFESFIRTIHDEAEVIKDREVKQ